METHGEDEKALIEDQPKGGQVLPAGDKVLVLTAAVGGGHAAAGQAVRKELERSGRRVVVEDGLRAMSPTLGWLLSRGYCSQVRNTPRSLAAVFAVTSGRAGAWSVRTVVGVLFARRLSGTISRESPQVIVSTYPLVSAALGRLRAGGGLRVPAAAIIADYGVHPLWVMPGLDAHLVVSRRSAELARRAGSGATLIRVPVDPSFFVAPTRDAARAALGIPVEAFVTLIVGGAWGIGDLEGAARCAVESGAYAVVVTGENAGLRVRLEETFEGREDALVLGWRDDMPALMAASDCLIQNAGGMTCLEAVQMDLPIILFSPIPGHGELNCRVMEEEGVALVVRDTQALGACLRAAVREEATLPTPKSEGAPGVATALDSLVGDALLQRSARRVLRPRPVLAAVAALVFFVWSVFASSGAALATKAFDLDVPGYDPTSGKVALAVRVTEPETAAAVEGMVRRERAPVTIFADRRGAGGLFPAPGLFFGVAEAPEERFSAPWKDRAQVRKAAQKIRRTAGMHPDYFLPTPRTNLAALAYAPRRTTPVTAETLEPGETVRPGLVVVDTSGLGPEAARERLARALGAVHDEGLECVRPDQL